MKGKGSESEGKMGSGLFEQAAGGSCCVWAAVRVTDTQTLSSYRAVNQSAPPTKRPVLVAQVT